jgi:hypothetical protein
VVGAMFSAEGDPTGNRTWTPQSSRKTTRSREVSRASLARPRGVSPRLLVAIDSGDRNTDPVNLVTLATGIECATGAGEWHTVRVLVVELEARRKARGAPGIVDLDAERRRRRDPRA